MRAKVRRWGKGLALRVRKKDLESVGVAEGDTVDVEVSRQSLGGTIDLAAMPVFQDDDPFTSVRHDRYLYE